MIVRSLQTQGAEHAGQALGATPGVTSFAPTTAREPGTGMIRGVGIESLFNRTRRQVQSLLAHRRFQRLQVEFVDGLAPQQRLNLVYDVGGQQGRERSFF
jgi:hypothetical protein